jgi:hypothetical protein
VRRERKIEAKIRCLIERSDVRACRVLDGQAPVKKLVRLEVLA